MLNCIYRFLNEDDEVIYIGKAKNLINRLNNHKHLPEQCYNERVKIEFIEFETEYEMDLAERYYIPKFNPKYNIVLKEKSIKISISEFDNKNWMLFNMIKTDEKKVKVNCGEIKDDIKLHIEQLKKEEEKKRMCDYNKRKVMCSGSGEIFNSLTEYKNYISTHYSLETLRKVASEEYDGVLGIYHPKYFKCFSRPLYLDIFEKYDNETKNRIMKHIDKNTRKVVCINNGRVYCNKYLVQHETDLKHIRVEYCCNNEVNYVGMLDNEPLVWKWYDEYLNMTQEDIDEYMNKAHRAYTIKNKIRK